MEATAAMEGACASDEHVLYEEREGMAWLTFNRPSAMNAMSQRTREVLPELIERAEHSPDVRCVVLTGAGRAFCTGADVKRLGEAEDREARARDLSGKVEALREYQRGTVLRLHHMAKPTIAAVNGYAIGAGLSFAMACDIRIAARSAKLCAGFGRIGVTGDTGLIWFLVHAIGRAATLELLYTSDMISADEGLRLGVVNKVFDDEDFAAQAQELAARIAAGSLRTNAGMKANVELALQADLAASLHQEALSINADLLSADHREALAALLEKRKPNFAGL